VTAIVSDLSLAVTSPPGAVIARLLAAALLLAIILRCLAVAAGPRLRPLARRLPMVIVPLLITYLVIVAGRLAAGV
jgi:hypothetical protein